MIELYEIKKNNDYDYYLTADLPDAVDRETNETFLADITDAITENVVRGYSYSWTGSSWKRIEIKQDTNTDIHGTIANTCKALNNYFFAKDNISGVCSCSEKSLNTFCDVKLNVNNIYILGNKAVYNDNTIEVVEDIPFIIGDIIYNRSERNDDKFGYITGIDLITGLITLDRSYISEISDNMMILSSIPEQVQSIINKMIWFDVYSRDINQQGAIASESAGSYSVSFKLDGMDIGTLVYPAGITNGLKNYQYARIC